MVRGMNHKTFLLTRASGSCTVARPSGEIDFSARSSVRLDLRSVERDGVIVGSDEC